MAYDAPCGATMSNSGTSGCLLAVLRRTRSTWLATDHVLYSLVLFAHGRVGCQREEPARPGVIRGVLESTRTKVVRLRLPCTVCIHSAHGQQFKTHAALYGTQQRPSLVVLHGYFDD